MSQDKKRLDLIEKSLTAKQAVILWVQEVHQYRNLFEYASYLRGQPETAAPLWRLPDQIEQAIRNDMKGQPKDKIWAAVQKSVRDVAFLIHLVMNVNERGMNKKREWALLSTVLSLKFKELIKNKDRISEWKEFTEQVLIELYSFEASVNYISQGYFDGLPVLFPDVSESLKESIESIENGAELFNHISNSKGKQKTEIDLEGLRQIAEKQVAEDRFDIINLSKAEALVFIGDRRTAIELIGRRL